MSTALSGSKKRDYKSLASKAEIANLHQRGYISKQVKWFVFLGGYGKPSIISKVILGSKKRDYKSLASMVEIANLHQRGVTLYLTSLILRFSPK